jgi:hypothetical protein
MPSRLAGLGGPVLYEQEVLPRPPGRRGRAGERAPLPGQVRLVREAAGRGDGGHEGGWATCSSCLLRWNRESRARTFGGRPYSRAKRVPRCRGLYPTAAATSATRTGPACRRAHARCTAGSADRPRSRQRSSTPSRTANRSGPGARGVQPIDQLTSGRAEQLVERQDPPPSSAVGIPSSERAPAGVRPTLMPQPCPGSCTWAARTCRPLTRACSATVPWAGFGRPQRDHRSRRG